MTESTAPYQSGTGSGSSGGSTAEDVKKAASDAADAVRAKAAETTQAAKAEAARRAEGAKSTFADEISGVASAFRSASGEFGESSFQKKTFDQIASGLSDASDALRRKDFGEMVSDVNAFARRNPMAFLGGAVLLGFAASRFAKASAEAEHSPEMTRPSSTSRPVSAGSANAGAVSGSQPSYSNQTTGVSR
ncbi:hypothetical protein [Oricola cellulosilytica]|uniref:Nutrient deprivation-induced protein n=1 Tax=Oricola cellulosilytica TaxID=1429082 RepID=A0A4R0PHA1_9HYPH|nr:hypothetical protein [Oricola cellulosilytica]TCD16398.1 hypothetical protein E0D97_02940 [Oricola cellulosilytica]